MIIDIACISHINNHNFPGFISSIPEFLQGSGSRWKFDLVFLRLQISLQGNYGKDVRSPRLQLINFNFSWVFLDSDSTGTRSDPICVFKKCDVASNRVVRFCYNHNHFVLFNFSYSNFWGIGKRLCDDKRHFRRFFLSFRTNFDPKFWRCIQATNRKNAVSTWNFLLKNLSIRSGFDSNFVTSHVVGTSFPGDVNRIVAHALDWQRNRGQ